MEEIFDEIIGKRFGKLVVEKFSHFYVKPSDGKKEKRWLCKCDCGGSTVSAKRKLQTGWTKSCGCLLKTRGGMSKEIDHYSMYSVLNQINQRCNNTSFPKYPDYGGRGISVCGRWDFKNPDALLNFIEDMGFRPSSEYTIERVDVNGDYCKENCIWTDDASLQRFNQRIKTTNTSGKTGVLFVKSGTKKKWSANIRKGDKVLNKMFMTFEEAAEQRDKWEIELYGFLKSMERVDDHKK